MSRIPYDAPEHRYAIALVESGWEDNCMFRRLASFTERHAALVIAGWVVAAVALAFTAPSLQKVGTQDQTAFLPAGSPSQRADLIIRRLFPNDPTLDAGIIVLARSGGLEAGDD